MSSSGVSVEFQVGFQKRRRKRGERESKKLRSYSFVSLYIKAYCIADILKYCIVFKLEYHRPHELYSSALVTTRVSQKSSMVSTAKGIDLVMQ